MRQRPIHDGENHFTVGASLLDALGRGALIGTASIIVGAMLGTAHVAEFGMWLLGLSTAAGVGLTVSAALCKNAGRNRHDPEPEGRQPAEGLSLVQVTPVLEVDAGTPAERRAAFVELVGRHLERQHGHGR